MSDVRGRPFQPGNRFGRGRPKGSRNKTTKLMEDLLIKHGESLMRKAILQAMQGDRLALRLCIERLFPVRRDNYVHLPLPGMRSIAEVDASSEALLSAVVRGKLTPTEGDTLSNLLENRRRVLETGELYARLEQLESMGAREEVRS